MPKGQRSDNKEIALKGTTSITKEVEMRVKDVAKWVAKGSSRSKIIDKIKETWGIGDLQAAKYYIAAVKYLAPTQEELEDYKKNLWMIQINRLERIMDRGMESDDPQMLRLAKDCIAELNKLIGLTGGDKVTVQNKSKDGDEQIVEITFSK